MLFSGRFFHKGQWGFLPNAPGFTCSPAPRFLSRTALWGARFISRGRLMTIPMWGCVLTSCWPWTPHAAYCRIEFATSGGFSSQTSLEIKENQTSGCGWGGQMTASHFVFDYDCTQVTEPCWPDLDIDIIFGFQYSITTWSQPNDTTPMPLKSLYMESIGHCNLPWLSHHWWFYTFVLISLLISLDNFYCEIMCSRTNASSDSRLPENAKALPCLDVIDAVRGHVGMAVDLQPRQVKQRNHLKCLQKKQQREFQSGEGANVSRSHDSQLWLRKSGLCAEMFG